MTEQSLKISIVTPSFNQGAYIASAIESVLSQNHASFEHIIVDNCSTDNTAAVLKNFSHLKVIREKDLGQSDALNKGFKKATGDIIGWLNADDKYLPGSFERVARAFADHPEDDLIYGDYRFVDIAGNLIRNRRELSFDFFVLKYLHVLYIPTTATFFRRKIFDKGNFLDINYHYAMDYEFFVRLAGQGYKFGHIPQMMADFRWHQDSKSTTQRIRQKEEMEKALLSHDMFLRSLQNPQRAMARNALMIMARGKRSILKLVHGAYWN
jgi:glycosyltransferase involved in cell wall biosynthesis